MRSPIYRKLYIGAAIAGFFCITLFPDVILGLAFEFFHFLFESLFELGHLLFEMIESILDKVVEHLFHTELHQTQVIVFYLMLSGGLYLGYLLLRVLIPFTRRCAKNLISACAETKNRMVDDWQHLELIYKIKWIALSALGLYLIFLMSF